MADLLDAAALYLRLIRMRVRAQLQYRASFALDVLGHFLVTFLDFVVILIIFANVPRLGEWSVLEVAVLYAISCLAFSLTDMVIGHLDAFPSLIRDGNFDLLLTRPRTTLFQVMTADFQLRRLGRTAQGAVILVMALAALDVHWTPERVAVLALTVPAGAVIFGSVWIAMICIAFWTVEGREAANAFTYGGQFLSQYPINIYDRWLRRFLAYVMPMAFIAYFPALFVLDKPDALGLPAWVQVLSPVVAVAAAVAATVMWRFGVRHYQSAGG